ADWIVDMTGEGRLPSPVPGRVHGLITAYRAIPPDQEPWNLVLNHGAGFERSALKVEHMRREEIAADGRTLTGGWQGRSWSSGASAESSLRCSSPCVRVRRRTPIGSWR